MLIRVPDVKGGDSSSIVLSSSVDFVDDDHFSLDLFGAENCWESNWFAKDNVPLGVSRENTKATRYCEGETTRPRGKRQLAVTTW